MSYILGGPYVGFVDDAWTPRLAPIEVDPEEPVRAGLNPCARPDPVALAAACAAIDADYRAQQDHVAMRGAA